MLYAFSFGSWITSLLGLGDPLAAGSETLLPEPWGSILQLVLALLGAASIAARLTPTPKDDAWIKSIRGWVNLLGLTKSQPPPDSPPAP